MGGCVSVNYKCELKFTKYTSRMIETLLFLSPNSYSEFLCGSGSPYCGGFRNSCSEYYITKPHVIQWEVLLKISFGCRKTSCRCVKCPKISSEMFWKLLNIFHHKTCQGVLKHLRLKIVMICQIFELVDQSSARTLEWYLTEWS